MKRRFFLFLFFLGTVSLSFAQVSAMLGDWATVDEKTGQKMAVVTLYKAADGLYYGRISRMKVGPAGLLCTECKGEDKDKPLEGLVIIREMKEEDGRLSGGRVLDPQTGKTYYAGIHLSNGRLVLRGSLDKRGIFGRNQVWERP